MRDFKTVDTAKTTSFEGNIKFLSSSSGYDVKVRLELLNHKKNRNNWIYENLFEHLNSFKGTPILISYKGGNLGAGHEMDEKLNPDGTVTRSFMSETAERIVGYIPENADVKLEMVNGVEWVVTDDAVIFGWYAPELGERLKGAGTLSAAEKKARSMRVSIETLIDEGYVKNDGTEVYTKYRVLGTTILSDTTTEAVAGANIRALSKLGVEKLREITKLRVASAEQSAKNDNSQKNNKKGDRKSMKITELKDKFNGFTVLAVDGENVALLSDNGTAYMSTATRDGDEIVTGVKKEIQANAVFSEGDVSFEIPIETVYETLISKNAALEKELSESKEACEMLQNSLVAMKKAEMTRRRDAIKKAISDRFNEIRSTCKELEENLCEDLTADAKISEYAEMETKDGGFCGDEQARKDVDARCMSKILVINKLKAHSEKRVFAWDIAKQDNSDIQSKSKLGDAIDAIIN